MWNIALDGNGDPMYPGTSSCGGGCQAIAQVNSDGSYSLNQECEPILASALRVRKYSRQFIFSLCHGPGIQSYHSEGRGWTLWKASEGNRGRKLELGAPRGSVCHRKSFFVRLAKVLFGRHELWVVDAIE